MISLRPVTSRVATRLSDGSPESVADRTIYLSRNHRCSVNPPIALSDEPERIRGHHAATDPKMNFERLTQVVVDQGPTRMHLLRDVLIGDGCIMSSRFFQRLGQVKRHFLLRGDPEDIREAALCTSYFTEKYFGHWLREGMAYEQLASDQGLIPLVVNHPNWSHETSYRRLLSMNPHATQLARCERLWLLDDPRYNAHFAERYDRVRDRLRTAVAASASPALRVFISRGKNACGRALANEEEVRHALSLRGFVMLEPEQMDAEDVARTLASARLVVAPEGSALAHAAIALPRGAGLLSIIGAQHFNMNYKALSDVLGFRFGFTIADALDGDRFSQPLDRLLRTIDLVDAAVDKSIGSEARRSHATPFFGSARPEHDEVARTRSSADPAEKATISH